MKKQEFPKMKIYHCADGEEKDSFNKCSEPNYFACMPIPCFPYDYYNCCSYIGPTGPQGPTGETGPVGPQGPMGETGPTGPRGVIGQTGPAGPQGAMGETGPAGPQGPMGETGPAGPRGAMGETGPAGPQGPMGATGPAGPQGAMGETGPAGAQGPMGATGLAGAQGPMGETGPAGAQGPMGETGPAGPQGAMGETGPVGPQGPIGETGPAGPQGPTGETGPTGSTGPTGDMVLAFGSLRGANVETPGSTFETVPFRVVGPLSSTVTVSVSGNELVVGKSGIYQITLSINAEATTDPDLDQPYLNAIITVNGSPIFGDTTTFFKISNRSSSTFVVQAALTAGDAVGGNIMTNFPVLGYMNRSLTIVQLSN